MHMNNPLVSIIVRTKDRPKLLKRALQSIAVQSYRPIEVIIVNDGGCDLDIEEIKTILGDVSLNYIRLEKNTGRAHAGNVGIENAKGEYIGFLDDDDEFYPHHIETVLSFLIKGGFKVVYSATEMVSEELIPAENKTVSITERTLSKDFSYNDLLIANYIPLNSILFDKKLLIAAQGFDVTFELYEDWDLLIRIGAENPFCHLNEVTVKYYQWDKDLQINRKDAAYMEAACQKIKDKHCSKKVLETTLSKESENDGLNGYLYKPYEKPIDFSEKISTEYENYLVALNELEDSEEDKREKAGQFTYRPKVSIVTPVYNVNEKWLKLAIESVINQVYDNWELCICDGGSTVDYVKTVIAAYAANDKRIKTKYLVENKGISGNSNEALSLATGDFICFLDHDDELPPAALYEVVKLLNEDQDLDFIYTDEDKLSPEDTRFEPHFKPDWSPDSFRSYNYITHLAVIRKKIIDETGGFRSEFDGSQDYDLFLRVVEKTQKIAHIPKVLYHWRSHSLSAAGDAMVKMYAYDSAKRALKEHLQRLGFEGDACDGPFLGLYRTKYHLKTSPLVTIIIPTKDRVVILKKCIESILTRSTYDNYTILIVDNQSSQEETFRYFTDIEDNPKVNIIRYDKPFNYSSINNYAVKHTGAEYIIFLNNDTEVISPDWIESMLEFVQRSDVGAAGGLLLYPDNTIQHAGIIIGLYNNIGNPFHKMHRDSVGYFGRNRIVQNLSAVTGACLMTRKSVFDAVEGFDENYHHDYSDIDFCLKIRGKDYLVVYTPYAQLYHHKHITAGANDTLKKHKYVIDDMEFFHKKWKNTIKKGDPYYNSNLTLLSEYFSIKKIPELVVDSNDSGDFCYGLVETHRSQLEALVKQNNPKDRDVHINNLEAILKHRDVHINNLEAILKHRDAHINNLEAIFKHRDAHINNLEAILKHRDAHINNLEAILKHRDVHINNLEAVLKHRDVHINNLEAILKEMGTHVANLEAAVLEKDTILNNIYRSRGWKVLSCYYRVKDKVIPANSLRRHFVKFLVNVVRNPMNVIQSISGIKIDKQDKREAGEIEKRFICGIESDFSQPLIVGKGNVFHLTGWCYHTVHKVKRLNVLADMTQLRIHNFCLARPDVLAEQCRETDSSGNSLNSGFWGLIPFSEIESPRRVTLTLRALLDNGEQCDQELGVVSLVPSRGKESDNRFERLMVSSSKPLVAICMTTYNPDERVFRRQIDSIIQQSYTNWVCIISDDCSRREIYESTREISSNDSRFFINRNSANLGFYHNFEKCLSLIPQEASYIAFSDQDDYWHPDKLEVLLSSFYQSTMLAYSDMNIVNEKGDLIHNTYWTTRKNNYRHLDTLLFANTVTGAASMIRSDLVPYLLPFPKKIGDSFHDHWMACVALAKGSIAYIDRPLYDYYQHQDNIIGHYTRSNAITFQKIREAFQKIRSGLKSNQISQYIKSLMWHSREVYLNDVVRIILIANILLLRCNNSTKKKISILKQFAGFEKSSCGILKQGLKGKLLRRSTLGAEFYCFRSVIMQRLMNSYYLLKKDKFLSRHIGFFPQKTSSSSLQVESVGALDVIKQKIAPLILAVSGETKKHVNLLIPTIDFKYFFGGYIGKFNFALRLSGAGYTVRIVIVDYCDYDMPAWKREIKKYEGLENFFDTIEVEYAFDRAVPLKVNPGDTFIATTWWTAHIAHKAVNDIKAERFVYFIQEYEPFTFPMGTFYALAQQTYRLPHYAIFSTELLRDYFRQNKIGVYSEGEHGDQRSVSFENAIQTFSVSEQDIRERKVKRFLYYARPEQHAARNMFDLGILALNRAIEEGCFDHSQWEFYGIGSVSNIESIKLSGNISMKLLQKVSLKEYAELLTGFDVGLSLMFTPHPSLPPLEMAAAGLVVVTNTFANKTEESLRSISSNIIAVEPTVEEVLKGIVLAIGRSSDYKSRIEGSNVNWSKSWFESFNDNVMSMVKAFCGI